MSNIKFPVHPEGKRVMQVFRESAPLEGVLPHYLAAEAARRLEEAGVTLVPSGWYSSFLDRHI